MRKITLLLVTAALLLVGVGGAQAEKQYLTFSCADHCAASWDAETNTFSWGSGGWNSAWTFMTADEISGDLSAWTRLHLHVSDFTNSKENSLKVVFTMNDGSWPPSGPTKEFVVSPNANGDIDITLTGVDWGNCDITKIQDLTIYGGARTDDNTDASVKVTDAYLYKPNPVADENVEITVGGETRNYQLYVPAAVENNCPLVISLHGAGGHSTDYSPFKKVVADAEGCIVAYPQGKDTWLLGNSTPGWTATGEDNFDVDFLKAVIEDVASKYSIDPKRIYCCGFSNGGMMTYAMANACSDKIAAFASISGFPLNEFHLRHTGSRPVPFLHIHGKDDDFVKYSLMPTIVDEMVARLGANPVPTTTPGNGYTKNEYAAGDGSFPYVYYEIDGMGHADYTANTEDGSSAKTMWNFFKDYTLDSQCDETLKWAPRIEQTDFAPASHGFTMNSGTTLLQFGGDQSTNENQNVYHSLQFGNGNYKLCFKSTGAAVSMGVKIEKLTSPNTVVLDETVNVGEDAELPFEVTDGWGEYKLTITRPSESDAITLTDINIVQTESTQPEEEIPVNVGTKTPILLTGGKISDCLTTGTRIIQMQGWQNFIAYENAEGISFDESSNMVFDLEETVANGNVRVTFTFDNTYETKDWQGNDITTNNLQAWWCLGTGTSADDTSTPYYKNLDESTFWLKKGFGDNFDKVKNLKITKVTVDNFNLEEGEEGNKTPVLVTYKVKGGTICGQPMTIKNSNTKTFGAYGGVFSATSAQSNIFKMENFAVGDYQKVVIKFGEPVPETGGWAYNYQSGVWPPSITVGATELEIPLNGTNLPELTIFNWNANPDPINISEVYFENIFIKATEETLVTDINDLSGTNTNWGMTYPKVVEGEAAEVIGDGNGSTEGTHVTITDYDWLCFEISDVTGDASPLGSDLRVWVWDGSKVVTLRPHPIAEYATVSNWEDAYYISTPGTYVVPISDYDFLKGAKTNWGSNATLTIANAYLSAGEKPVENVPTGKYTLTGDVLGSASLTGALADANAIYFDATGVTGTGVDLTSVANPNALFKAPEGALSNTNNVIINDVCAQLAISDGYPFKAPVGFAATAASYNRIFTADNTTTVCLPFALTSDEAASLGTFYAMDGFDGATIHFESVDEPAANTPYLVVPSNTSLALSGGKDIAITPANLGTGTDVENIEFIGTLSLTEIPASDNTYSYYAYNNGTLVKIVSQSAKLPAFRGYFKVTNSAIGGARSLNISFGENKPTGIQDVNYLNDGGKMDIYFDLQGRRVATPQKGLYIVNGKKVIK